MATTKKARYRFVVKEASGFEETCEPRDGVINIISTPVTFIVAEPSDRKPPAERPFEGSVVALELPPGTSVDEAQQIADFFNDHVEQVGITRFGDAEDAARDVRLSERSRKIHLDRFTSVLVMWKDKLKVNDAAGLAEATKAVESVFGDLIIGWEKSNRMSREILKKFGTGEDEDDSDA